jgi:hypothetical protein
MHSRVVVMLERLMNPRTRRQVFHEVIRMKRRDTFFPQHTGADFFQVCIALRQLFFDDVKRVPGIDHIVNDQYTIAKLCRGHREMLRDEQFASHRAAFFDVTRRAHDREWLIENARELIADTQAPARDANDVIELPLRIVNFDREFFDQAVVAFPGYIKMSGVNHVGAFKSTVYFVAPISPYIRTVFNRRFAFTADCDRTAS